ncbi:MAG: glycosyltransferase family 4 protein [Vicinamibacterales bacterium]
MPVVVLATAGRLETLTGGSVYNRRMAEALRRLAWRVDVVELDGTFPEPDDAARAAADAAFAALPDGSLVLADGLALSALPDVVSTHGGRLRVVALVHLPVAAAPGLDAAAAARLAEAERRALAGVSAIVVTGPGALPLLRPYGIQAADVAMVEPGVDPAPPAGGSTDGDVHLLTVATVNAGKGHDVLLDALARIELERGGAAPPWRLTCVGSLTRDADTARRVQEQSRRLGLQARVTFTGELRDAALDRAWHAADVFVLASRRETYGMAVAEAVARALPVVGTDTGAIPLLVAGGAGLVVPPGDVAALAGALARVVTDASCRARLRSAAATIARGLPTWDEAAARMASVLGGV